MYVCVYVTKMYAELFILFYVEPGSFYIWSAGDQDNKKNKFMIENYFKNH